LNRWSEKRRALYAGFVLKYLVAPFTPVLNVSDECFEASMVYVAALQDTRNYAFVTNFAMRSET
jgi:hypothetical protein